MLRYRRAHACAETRGHHDGGKLRARCAHVESGWGARVRTWDRRTKTRCLTTWLRPISSRLVEYKQLLRAPARLVRAVVQQQVERDHPEDTGQHKGDSRDREGHDRRDNCEGLRDGEHPGALPREAR